MDTKHVKIGILGEQGSGKTTLLNMICRSKDEIIEKPKPSIGFFYMEKQVELDGKHLILEFWDTSGQEIYNSLTLCYLRNVDILLLMGDLTNNNCVHSVNHWLEKFEEGTRNKPKIIIIGNKLDMLLGQTSCPLEKNRSFVDFNKYIDRVRPDSYFPISAEKNINVDLLTGTLYDIALNVEEDFDKPAKINIQNKVVERSCC